METSSKTLYEAFFRVRNVFIDVGMILVSVLFMALMANLTIPLWPVPITMQTFGVFAIAFWFGSRKGLVSMVAYVLAGLVGFGVFAGWKSGLDAVMGPTGGYIVGFLAAVFVVGMMVEKGYGRDKKSVFLCMVIGNLLIYTFGIIGLMIYFPEMVFWKVLTVGLFPFLVGDLLKIALSVGIFPYLWKGSEKLSSKI